MGGEEHAACHDALCSKYLASSRRGSDSAGGAGIFHNSAGHGSGGGLNTWKRRRKMACDLSNCQRMPIWQKLQSDPRFAKILEMVTRNQKPCAYAAENRQFELLAGPMERRHEPGSDARGRQPHRIDSRGLRGTGKLDQCKATLATPGRATTSRPERRGLRSPGRQFSRGSNDNGKTWFVEYDFTYNRVKGS